MTTYNRATLAGLLLALLTGAGCTAIADVDSFQNAPVCDLDLHVRDFDPHIDDLFEVRAVRDEDDQIRAIARLEPLPSTDTDIRLPNAIGEAPHRIDFFADQNNNRVYDDPMADHTWRITDPCVDQPKVFPHVFDFQPLPDRKGPGNLFRMTFEQMEVGVAFELRIEEPATEERPFARTVGLYHIPRVPDPDPENGDDFDGAFTVELPVIIEDGQDYEISFWSDRNDNGRYDPPDTDEAWRETRTGGPSGLELSFVRIEEYFDIEEVLVETPEMP